MERYSGQLKRKKYEIISKKSHHKDKNGKYKINRFCNDIFTFDIETTSAWINEKGEIIPYYKGKDADYWNNLQPLALCYIWQFGFNDEVYYGRDLSDFLLLLDDLPKADICIFIHNLAFEFQFLASILTWSSVFAKNNHKPMKAIAEEYPHITFRCSYFLTRLSLDAWGKQIGYEKKSGNLDYEKIRTPLTLLQPKEIEYCETDIIVMYKGLLKYKQQYKYMKDIPLTQTGTIRQVIKELLTTDDGYVARLKKLIPKDTQEYKLLQEIFAGGYTHANRLYAGEVIDLVDQIQQKLYKCKLIKHFDFASSYPTVMICEKYPMTPWVNVGRYKPKVDEFEDCAFIMKICFKKINSTNYNTYIQSSKCTKLKHPIYDNGRVISADEIEITITEQDYITIINNYNFETMEILECYKSYKDYLPIKLVKYILELYGNKTSLKDVVGFEDIYMQAKQYINSVFGMMVTAIVQANVKYHLDGSWSMDRINSLMVEDKLDKLRNFNPRERRYFLSYSWGCYVTAYARRNLWKCIEKCGEHGKSVLYVDTDSIFCLGNVDFSWYDEEITNKLKKACDDMKIDFALTRPKTPKGKEKPLGLFTEETPCTQFISLGAKRYCERRIYLPNDKEADGNLHLTISGINKQAVDLLGDNIYNFIDGFCFDKDSDYVTKKITTYINNQPTVKYPDGYVSKYKTGINLRRNGYNLSLTDEYRELIDYDNIFDELDWENLENKFKAKIW